MPFVTYTDIKSLLPKGVQSVLQAPPAVADPDNPDRTAFDDIEPLVALFISNETGYPIPEDVSTRPDWVVLPAAWLFKKLCNPAISSQSPEYMAEVEGDYQRAVATLQKHRTTPTDATKQNTLTGVYPVKGVLAW